jgi:hypothetical protein
LWAGDGDVVNEGAMGVEVVDLLASKLAEFGEGLNNG